MLSERKVRTSGDELRFSIETLKCVCTKRGDVKNLGELVDIALSVSNEQEAAARILRLCEKLERVIKTEEMEVLYPFEKIKQATHEFGASFLEGYFDWGKVSADPYEVLGMIEKMLNDVEVSRNYAKKFLTDRKG
jgi:hypothetical protein